MCIVRRSSIDDASQLEMRAPLCIRHASQVNKEFEGLLGEKARTRGKSKGKHCSARRCGRHMSNCSAPLLEKAYPAQSHRGRFGVLNAAEGAEHC
jgi:hypothetical protein